MSQIEVLPPPNSSASSYFLPKDNALDLVRLGRADQISPKKVRLIAAPSDSGIDPEVRTQRGYNNAVKQTPVSDFRQVWGMRNSGGVDMWQYTANSKSKALEV